MLRILLWFPPVVWHCRGTYVIGLHFSVFAEFPPSSEPFDFQPFSDEPKRAEESGDGPKSQNGNGDAGTKTCMDPKMIKWNSLPDSLETAIIPRERKLQMVREQFMLEAEKKRIMN